MYAVLYLFCSDSDVWDSLSIAYQGGSFFTPSVLSLLYTTRPHLLETDLLQVCNKYLTIDANTGGDTNTSGINSTEDINQSRNEPFRKSCVTDVLSIISENVALPTSNHNIVKEDSVQYDRRDITGMKATDIFHLKWNPCDKMKLWNESFIVESIIKRKKLFQYCCFYFHNVFINTNLSLTILFIASDFFKQVLLIENDLLKFFPSNCHIILKFLLASECFNMRSIDESLVDFINYELNCLMNSNCPLPFITAVLSINPQWISVLHKKSSILTLMNIFRLTSQ